MATPASLKPTIKPHRPAIPTPIHGLAGASIRLQLTIPAKQMCHPEHKIKPGQPETVRRNHELHAEVILPPTLLRKAAGSPVTIALRTHANHRTTGKVREANRVIVIAVEITAITRVNQETLAITTEVHPETTTQAVAAEVIIKVTAQAPPGRRAIRLHALRVVHEAVAVIHPEALQGAVIHPVGHQDLHTVAEVVPEAVDLPRAVPLPQAAPEAAAHEADANNKKVDYMILLNRQ